MAKKKSRARNPKMLISLIAGAIVLIVGALDYFGIISLTEKQAEISVNPACADANDTVNFIDVGQGNCTLVKSGDSAMLIDAGEVDKGKDVVSYLKALRIRRLDYIIISHQHTDHMGGVIEVINSDIEVGKIIMPKIPEKLTPTSYTYTKLLNEIKNEGLSVRAARDEEFYIGSIKVNTYAMEGDYSNLNNYSVVTKFTANAGSFIIMGDLEKTAEKELLNKNFDFAADVILVGHHGSSSSSSDSLLKRVNPSCAVISVGTGNKYGHPNDSAIKRIKNYTDKIYRTDLNGNIVFDCDNKELRLSIDKDD